MAETSRLKTRNETDSEAAELESSELFESVQRSVPAFSSNKDAAQAAANRLEQLAADHGMSMSALIEQAHTTGESQPYHIEALSLERQLAFFRR